MTSESVTSLAIPPPQEQHTVIQQPPQNPLISDPISAVTSSRPKFSMEDYLNSYGTLTEKYIDEIGESDVEKHLNSKEYIDKFKRYEAEFKQYLWEKYFAGKDPNGEVVYEIITSSSKWPCTRCYADPEYPYEDDSVECIDEGEVVEENSVDSPSVVEISPGDISNGGTVSEKKNSS